MGWIISGNRQLEFTELAERSARAARGLKTLGVHAGDTIALFLRNDLSFVEASLAAGYLGAYPVPLNWHSTAAEADYIFRDSGAKVVVVHSDLLPQIRSAVPPDVSLFVVSTPSELLCAYGGAAAETVEGENEDWSRWLCRFPPIGDNVLGAPGAMIYTSGTTGRPKGVRRLPPSAAQAQGALEVVAASYGLAADETPIVSLVTAPLYHSAPNIHAMTSLRIGANLIIQPRFDPEETLAAIERWSVTHVYFAPIMFKRLLQLPPTTREQYNLSSLKYVVHAAAPCPSDVKQAMIAWFGPIVHEFYGSTETRALVSCSSEEWLQRPGTVGRALPGAVVKILDAEGEKAPVGTPGEIVGGHPELAGFTYHCDEAKRQSVARGDLVATGDIGHLDDEGYLFICDRSSDMVISGGVNIYPAEIEAALTSAPGVLDCAVFGIPDDEFGEALLAIVQSVDGRTLDVAALTAFLRERLSGFKIPRRIEQTDALPREESGKIFKRKLRGAYWREEARQI